MDQPLICQALETAESHRQVNHQKMEYALQQLDVVKASLDQGIAESNNLKVALDAAKSAAGCEEEPTY